MYWSAFPIGDSLCVSLIFEFIFMFFFVFPFCHPKREGPFLPCKKGRRKKQRSQSTILQRTRHFNSSGIDNV